MRLKLTFLGGILSDASEYIKYYILYIRLHHCVKIYYSYTLFGINTKSYILF